MSNDTLVVYKARTNVVTVSLGMDVSADTITSKIKTLSGFLIATWTVAFDSDGTDGELILTMDDTVTAAIEDTRGMMDLKRVTSGEPVQVIDMPIEVEFRTVVTD